MICETDVEAYLVIALCFTVAALIISHSVRDDLRSANRQYRECIALGAPEQNCLKKYLLIDKVD